MTRLRNAAFAAIAGLCLSAGQIAFAQDREPVSVRVETADLDLASAAGAARLDQRIRAAVANACASTLPGLDGMRDRARCRAEMTADATVKLAALKDRAATVRVASAR